MSKTLILAISLLFFSANCVAQSPDIFFDTPEFNFGKINEGEKITHEFKIINKGDTDLLIEKIISDCGCIVVVSPVTQAIKPQASASLKIDFNSRGFSGNQLRTLLVYSNDPDERAASIFISGDVVPEINIDPGLLTLNPNSAATKNVKLNTSEFSTAEIVSVSETSKYFEIKNQQINSKNASFDVVLAEEIPLGEFRERITIKLKNSARQLVNLPVLISKQPVITVLPQNLALGIIGSQPEYRISLTNSLSKQFSILGVEAKHQAIKVQTALGAPAVQHELIVTLEPNSIGRDIRSLIRVKTDQEDEPEITISVYGIKSDLGK